MSRSLLAEWRSSVLRGASRRALLASLAGMLFVACVTVKSGNYATAPAPGWTVYSSIPAGVTLALPPGWRGYDLATELDTAATDWAVAAGITREDALARLRQMTTAGRFFALAPDEMNPSGRAIAYVLPLGAADVSVDSVLDAPQAPGRVVVDRIKLHGAAGDVTRQRVTYPAQLANGSSGTGTQLAYVVVVDGRMYGAFIEVPELASADFLDVADKLALSFHPIP